MPGSQGREERDRSRSAGRPVTEPAAPPCLSSLLWPSGRLQRDQSGRTEDLTQEPEITPQQTRVEIRALWRDVRNLHLEIHYLRHELELLLVAAQRAGHGRHGRHGRRG